MVETASLGLTCIGVIITISAVCLYRALAWWEYEEKRADRYKARCERVKNNGVKGF